MKKNITINLFGSLYNIDVDAYELLEKYLDNMKRYFSKRDGGDEIADDIEHRVAELFEELKTRGSQAIAIEDVQAIIKRIGNPEDMEEDVTEGNDTERNTENTEKDDNRKSSASRKLYRNPDNQVLGGVLSGLCTYFGGNDPLPWRIIFVVLAIATQLLPFFLIYLVLWAFMPMAVTAEDKLRMKGKPINVDTLNEEIMTDAETADKSKIRSIFTTLVTIIGFCLKLFIGLIVGITLLAAVIVGICLAVGVLTPITLLGFDSELNVLLNDIVINNGHAVTYAWVSVLSAILFLGIVFYSIVHSIISRNNNDRMTGAVRISMIVISLAALISSVSFGIASFKVIDGAADEYDRKMNTVDGIYLAHNQHERLAEMGCDIVTYENASDVIFRSVRSFVDDDRRDYVLSFRRNKSDRPMKVNLVRTEDFPAGIYHIEAVVSAKCNGAYVYARNDSSVYASAMIPVDDSYNKGNMKNMSNEELRRTAFFNFPASDDIWEDDDFREVADYWSYVRSASFSHKGGPISYGTTNLGSVIGKNDSSSPAWSFMLRKIKIVADK